MKTAVAASIVGLAFIALVSFFLYSQYTNPVPVPSTGAPPITESTGATGSSLLDSLKQGGSTFTDPAGVFTFLYPNDWKLDAQGEGRYIRIYKAGATQQGQTEMYDGRIMVFESINLQGQALDKWVDAYIKTSTSGGTAELTRAKEAVTVNGYPGFRFTIRGLGEAEYLVLQTTPASTFAVMITTSINDPEQKGYQREVDTIISTVDLHK
jgi:hypothetical protein